MRRRGWTDLIRLDAEGRLPIFVQIGDALTAAMRAGVIKPGERVPGARELSATLGVNRNTVTAAYDALESEGWVRRHAGSGTFVNDVLPRVGVRRTPHAGRDPERVGFALHKVAQSVEDAAVRPGLLKWDFGSPDPRLAPVAPLARAYRRALRKPSELLYQRYRAEVHSPLQRVFAELCRQTRGMQVTPEDILITAGSQMGLFLVASVLLRPGDVLAMEEPGYYPMPSLAQHLRAEVLSVPVDAEGLRVDVLEAHAKRRAIRAVFLTPHHQMPTTVTLSPSRRIELLRVARAHRIAILEDDFDPQFHYATRPIAPLAAIDRDGLVVHFGSLSKVVAPALRLGYVTGPRPLLNEARSLAHHLYPDAGGLFESAIAELHDDGELERHLNRSRRIYRGRRDHLVALLRRELGEALETTAPPGGIAVWARVAPGIDASEWASRAEARGLLVRTGAIFYHATRPEPAFRLGFAMLDEREIQGAVRLLREALPRRRGRQAP
jgi:GntR family transcriptional regulator / MocR family aminotransferase